MVQNIASDVNPGLKIFHPLPPPAGDMPLKPLWMVISVVLLGRRRLICPPWEGVKGEVYYGAGTFLSILYGNIIWD